MYKSNLYNRKRALYTSADVTIVVPTIDGDNDFFEAAQTWLQNSPHEIIVVTTNPLLDRMRILVNKLKDKRIRVRSISTAGKRPAMVAGLQEVTTRIVVFVDDDVRWKTQTLEGLLAGLEDPCVGGIQTCQKVRPINENGSFTTWEVFGAARLSRRSVYLASSAFYIDGDFMNLSGRTMAFPTRLIKTPDFMHAFTEDFWRQKYHLKSGDDCFLTSWIVHRGWKTSYSTDRDCEIITTMKSDSQYLKQLVRWSRNTARYWWRDFWFAIHQNDPRHHKRVLLNAVTAYLSDLVTLLDLVFTCFVVLDTLVGLQAPEQAG
jgi:cellulose synthase/poly-beta-1,6-N-acetylglucosamine synthase-like glycosyltransferase